MLGQRDAKSASPHSIGIIADRILEELIFPNMSSIYLVMPTTRPSELALCHRSNSIQSRKICHQQRGLGRAGRGACACRHPAAACSPKELSSSLRSGDSDQVRCSLLRLDRRRLLDASHLVIFAAEKNFGATGVDAHCGRKFAAFRSSH